LRRINKENACKVRLDKQFATKIKIDSFSEMADKNVTYFKGLRAKIPFLKENLHCNYQMMILEQK